MNFPIILSEATKKTNDLGSAFGLKIIKKLNQKIIFRAIILFMAIMGDRRVTADMKTTLCVIEFSREFNDVSVLWDA